MILRWMAAALCTAVPAGAESVNVQVLGLFHPASIVVTTQELAEWKSPSGWRRWQAGTSLTLSWVREGRVNLHLPGGDSLSVMEWRGAGDHPFLCTVALPGRKFERAYRGRFRARAGKRALELQVTVELESYVEGVLRAEMSNQRMLQAAAAQAVVMRTFARRSRGRHGSTDVCDTTHCQLYQGEWTRAEAPGFPVDTPEILRRLARDAVALTKGMELMRGSRPANVNFCASCSGETASSQEIWGEGAKSGERVVCQHPEKDPWRSWARTVPFDQAVSAVLGRASVGSAHVKIVSQTPRGRYVTGVEVKDQSGVCRVTGEQFRLAVGRAVGWNVVLSNAFSLQRKGPVLEVTGSGFGHGVGLCQAGVHYLASQGWEWKNILLKYFPGCTVHVVNH